MLLFGRLRDLAGWREKTLDPAPATISALRDVIAHGNAALAEALVAQGVQVAVDQAIVRGNALLSATAEVAFLPPMSGG